MMDESAIINVIINSGVLAVFFYLFITRVSDKLDKLIEEVSKMNARLDIVLRFINDRGDRHGLENS